MQREKSPDGDAGPFHQCRDTGRARHHADKRLSGLFELRPHGQPGSTRERIPAILATRAGCESKERRSDIRDRTGSLPKQCQPGGSRAEHGQSPGRICPQQLRTYERSGQKRSRQPDTGLASRIDRSGNGSIRTQCRSCFENRPDQPELLLHPGSLRWACHPCQL